MANPLMANPLFDLCLWAANLVVAVFLYLLILLTLVVLLVDASSRILSFFTYQVIIPLAFNFIHTIPIVLESVRNFHAYLAGLEQRLRHFLEREIFSPLSIQLSDSVHCWKLVVGRTVWDVGIWIVIIAAIAVIRWDEKEQENQSWLMRIKTSHWSAGKAGRVSIF